LAQAFQKKINMIIYGCPGSQPYHALLALFYRHKDIPFKFELRVPGSTRAPKGARTPEFMKISPSAAVPAMDDDGFILYESAAIMQYICEKHKLKEYPTEPSSRALVNQYLHWHHQHTRYIALIMRSHFRPEFNQAAKNEQEAAKIVKPITAVIENMLAKNTYLASEDCTIADLQCYMEMHQVLTCNLCSLDDFPNTKAWLERMAQEEGIQEVLNDKSVQKLYEGVKQARAKM